MKGRCECGAVLFEVKDARPEVTVCHCGQCRRTSGHLWASTVVADDDLVFQSEEALVWYESSDFAKRGFCGRCGSSLFYKMHNEPHIAVAAGCFDDPTGLSITKHIFAKDKGDYYDIADGAVVLQTY